MHKFPVKISLRIDWSEMDLFGHVNNVSYFKYIQAARVHYWEVSKLAELFQNHKIGPILLSTGCQFIKPLFYPDKILVESRIEFIKTTSFGIHHQILNGNEEIAAEAHDVIVTYDFKKNEKIAIPDSFRNAVFVLEGGYNGSES